LEAGASGDGRHKEPWNYRTSRALWAQLEGGGKFRSRHRPLASINSLRFYISAQQEACSGWTISSAAAAHSKHSSLALRTWFHRWDGTPFRASSAGFGMDAIVGSIADLK
jgi:hypothetical protein